MGNHGFSPNQDLKRDYYLVEQVALDLEVVKRLAQTHGAPWKAGQSTITIKRDGGRKVLTVSPAAAAPADCGVKPGRDVRSIIMVSDLIGGRNPGPE